MRELFLLITLFLTVATLAEIQTCANGDPATALGTYCKSDFDGGRIIPPANRRTPPPSLLDDPDPKLTPGDHGKSRNMVVDIPAGSSFNVGKPRVLFVGTRVAMNPVRGYDINA
jgi:hypothetical protein